MIVPAARSSSIRSRRRPISGPGGISYSSSGSIFEVNAANTYTGETFVFFGHVSILNDSAFGNGGVLRLSDVSTQGVVQRALGLGAAARAERHRAEEGAERGPDETHRGSRVEARGQSDLKSPP